MTIQCKRCGSNYALRRMFVRDQGEYIAAGWLCVSCRHTEVDNPGQLPHHEGIIGEFDLWDPSEPVPFKSGIPTAF